MSFTQIAGFLVLLSPAWTPASLLTIRGIPTGTRFLLVAALGAYAATAVWIAATGGAALGPLALLVLAGWIGMAWRARERAGARRGLPPGSFGLRSSLRALADYSFYEKQAARYGPVFKTCQYHRPVVCIVGLERCQRFMREHRERLTSAPLPVNAYIAGGLIRYMEPDKHRKYRRLLQSCMKTSVVECCEGIVERMASLELSKMAERCSRRMESGVSPYPGIERFVFLALSQMFFDIKPEAMAVPRLRDLYRDVDHRKLWRRASRTRGAMSEIVALVADQAGRLAETNAASPTSFLDQAIRNGPDLVADPIFIQNLVYLFHVARCDVNGLCSWLLRMLADHPDEGLRIRTSPEGSRPASADRFVDETLRLRQSEYLYRTTSAALEFEGFSVPAGWLVRLCIRESHTSAEAFDRPHEFDPDRFLPGSPSPGRYQPFGIYEHACLGVAVTRTIGRILVEQLASGFDLSITRDGPMELGLQHHRHWAPSRRLEVRLSPASRNRLTAGLEGARPGGHGPDP